MCRCLFRVTVLCMVAIVLAATVHYRSDAQEASPTNRPAEVRRDEISNRYYIWKDDNNPGRFVPNGYMPDGLGVSLTPAEEDDPHSLPHCLRCDGDLGGTNPWVGVYFLHRGEWEPEDACNLDQELKLTDQETSPQANPSGRKTVCRFWVRSKSQKAPRVQFKVGGVVKGKVKDSLKIAVATKWITLTPQWTMHEIDVTGKDLSSLVGGFMWVCDRQHNDAKPFEFDLDDIYFVKTHAAADDR